MRICVEKDMWDDRYVCGRDYACELLEFKQLWCLCLCGEKKLCVEEGGGRMGPEA